MVTLITVSTTKIDEIFEISHELSKQEDVYILFMEEGCKLFEDENIIQKLSFAKLFVLEYVYEKKIQNVEIIDYYGWIKLLELCSNTIYWT